MQPPSDTAANWLIVVCCVRAGLSSGQGAGIILERKWSWGLALLDGAGGTPSLGPKTTGAAANKKANIHDIDLIWARGRAGKSLSGGWLVAIFHARRLGMKLQSYSRSVSEQSFSSSISATRSRERSCAEPQAAFWRRQLARTDRHIYMADGS